MKALTKWIIICGIVLLLLPLAVRMLNGMPLMPGSEGYGHARIAELIAKEGIPEFDPAMPERKYSFNIFNFVLAGFAKLAGINTAAVLFPLLLGIATLLCAAVAMRKWKLQAGAFVLLVFAFSPFFVDVFTQAVPRGLELFLLVLYLVVLSPAETSRSARTTLTLALAAVIIAALLASLGVVPAIAAFVLPMVLRTISRRVQPIMLSASIAAFVVLVAFSLPLFLQNEEVPFDRPVPIVQAVSDFGGSCGLSIFAWLLAFIGFILLWQYKKKYYAAMITMGIALVASLLLPSALAVAQVLVAFLAGYAIAFFVRMKWFFHELRILTIFVLVCGLLFSTLAHGIALAKGPPSIEFREASFAIRDALPENATVFSYPSDGFWMEYWSGRQAFLDGWAARTPDISGRWNSAQAIWHSQDIMQLRPLLYRNNIDALVITKEMREGKVWDLPEQDLLFLLRNNETFKKAYNSSSVDIWAVLPPGKPE